MNRRRTKIHYNMFLLLLFLLLNEILTVQLLFIAFVYCFFVSNAKKIMRIYWYLYIMYLSYKYRLDIANKHYYYLEKLNRLKN